MKQCIKDGTRLIFDSSELEWIMRQDSLEDVKTFIRVSIREKRKDVIDQISIPPMPDVKTLKKEYHQCASCKHNEICKYCFNIRHRRY